MHFINNGNGIISSPSISSPTSSPLQEVQTVKHRIEVEPLDETLVCHIKEALLPYNHPTSRHLRRYLLDLIGEYTREEMSLKRFFIELRSLPSPITHTNGDFYRWLIQLLICLDKDPACKVMSYLLENGIDENDIEFGSVKRLLSMCHADETTEKKKERTRVRKSVSKGLRNPPNKWTKEESQRLIQLVNDYGDKSWKKIAEHVGGGKTGAQCAQHWKRVLCPVIRKGSWDDTEELKLFQLVEKYGQSWKNIASEIGSRTDIQCRYQYFKSSMSREVAWVQQEDDLLTKKINEIKAENREIHWVEVARYMARGRLTKIPRTGLECRSRYEYLASGGTGPSQPHIIQTPSSPSRKLPSVSLCAVGLCLSPPDGFSDLDSADEDLDTEMGTVPDTLVIPEVLAI